ncbi:MAG: CPBP family intramembrane metalloprotease [Bacteroidetes bacterium]|nr:CPBP family intramembrane metalloprotease [Bacteroidota bacterium]
MKMKDFFSKDDEKEIDVKIIMISVLSALCLTMNKYLPEIQTRIHFSENEQLSNLAKWVFILCGFYFVVPALVIKIVFKEKLSDYGLRWKGAFKNYYLYLIMLGVMIPLVYFFSKTAAFQAKYPFYELNSGEKLYPNFWIWETLYFLQFFSLEFFFRGFMVHGMKHRFGVYSVLVMTIPYCMIHFGKPLPETIAAIVAGIVLGVLSLKSRSILLGVCIHFSVGLMMDMAALWQKGML